MNSKDVKAITFLVASLVGNKEPLRTKNGIKAYIVQPLHTGEYLGYVVGTSVFTGKDSIQAVTWDSLGQCSYSSEYDLELPYTDLNGLLEYALSRKYIVRYEAGKVGNVESVIMGKVIGKTNSGKFILTNPINQYEIVKFVDPLDDIEKYSVL